MKDLTLSIILDLSLERITQGLKKFNAQFKKALKETEDSAKVSSRELDAAFKTLGIKSLKEVEFEIKKLKLAYDTLKRSGQISAREQAKAQIELKKRIRELGDELNGWSKSLASLKENWLAFVGLFAGTGYTLQKVTQTFVAFDDAMRQVAAVSGASGEEFKKMVEVAREMGATTRYSASESAEAMKYLAMAGLNASQIIRALPEVLNLASATATDLAQSADIVTNIMSQYGMQVSELSRANDVLVKATTSTNSNLMQLGNAFSYAGSIAKSAGLSFEETVAILGQLHNAGIKGERAGTALRGALSRLLKPSKEAEQTLSKLGVSIYDSTGKLRPFLDILDDLQKAGVSTADIITIFGQEAGPGIQALLTIGIDAIRALLKELRNSQGVAKKTAEQMESGLGGSLRELKSALEELQIAFGDTLGPILTILVRSLTGLIRALQETDTATKALVGTLGTLGTLWVAWRLGLSKVYESLVLLRAGLIDATGAAAGLITALTTLGAIYGTIQIGRLIKEVYMYKKAMNDLSDTANWYKKQAEELKAFSNVAIKTQEELNRMSEEEIEAYKERLKEAMRYWSKLEASLIVQKEERNIFLQKTEAAKQAEKQYEEVAKKAEQYRQALYALVHVQRESSQVESQVAKADYKELWEETTKNIQAQTEALKENIDALKQAHEFRLRLIKTEKGAEAETAIYQEQKRYISELKQIIIGFYNTQIQEIDKVISKEKELASSTSELQEQILRKKIEVANTAKNALISALNEIQLKEREYANQVKALSDEIINAQMSFEDELRALKRSKLSEEEQIADKIQQAFEKQSKAREELEKGNFELAKRLAQQAKSIYADIARSSKEHFEEAYKGVEEAGSLYIDILKKQKEEAQKKWEEQKKLTQELRDSIKALNEDIKAFLGKLEEIPDEKKAKILFEASGLKEIKDEYDKIQDKDVYVTVHQRIVEAHQSGGLVGLFRGGKLPGYGGGDKIKALLEAGEFVIKKEAVRKYGVGLLSAINNLRFNLPSISLPDLKFPKVPQQQGFDTSLYRRFEINIGGARLEGFAIKDVIDEFEQHLRRRRLCGA